MRIMRKYFRKATTLGNRKQPPTHILAVAFCKPKPITKPNTNFVLMTMLIVEDDQRVSELTKRGLEEQGISVDVAYDGFYGRKLALQNTYDLIITDIILPGLNGLDLCKEIRRIKPETPIIMLTALGTTDEKIVGFDAGADDYLVKPFEMRELLARIRAVMNRQGTNVNRFQPILTFADLEMNLHTKIVKRNDIEISLTPKEFNLLKYFLQNPNRVLSRAEIAE